MTKSIPTYLSYGVLTTALLALPSQSHGHASLDSPPARDYGMVGADAHKDPNGPCGNIAPTTKPMVYQIGANIQVKFTETVDHPGCFLFGLSSKSNPTLQSDFTQIGNIKHSALGGIPRPYTGNVQLPMGMSCSQCTLQMRQIMLANDTTPCPPATISAGVSYYSCADVQIGTVSSVDMASPSQDAGTKDAGTTDPPSMGCHLAPHAAAGNAGLFVLLGAVGALLRRRRQRMGGGGRAAAGSD